MKSASIFLCWLFCLSSPAGGYAADILLYKKDAVVWFERQTITGRLNGFFTNYLKALCNDGSYEIQVRKDSTFSFSVDLQKGENKIVVETIGRGSKVYSDTVILTLGFNATPVVKPYAISRNGRLTLHAKIIRSPRKQRLQYLWTDDPLNPSSSKIISKSDSVAIVSLPAVNGIYYFNLTVSTSEDTLKFKTFVVRNGSHVDVFNMDEEHAPWIDSAIIYQITPSAFIRGGNYDDIADKLPEIKQLGINTIWLQPVYATPSKGQGYNITDYFSLREDFGTEQQLKKLVDHAKSLQLRVLFDFVPNHTSIQHPYAQNVIKYGTQSHYYDFYQHENDGAPYSSYYKKNEQGFITYFWDDLVNLNYNNEEVQQWIIEACKYWIRKFDIDGYRFDAVWAVNARAPSFAKRLRTELKSIKPDFMMLAEDKGSVTPVYNAGFDVAYDWAADTSWISHWSWQYQYDPQKSFTVFNHPDVKKRASLLRQALFDNGDTANLRLRFMENNDLPRFIKDHGIERTKMAAALLFALPGVPMMYNGQEIGYTNHPYTRHSVFLSERSIQSNDSSNLFSYYQKLIALRKRYPALQSGATASLPVHPEETIVGFRRWNNNEQFIVLLNMDSVDVTATIDGKNILSRNQQNRINGFVDLLTNSNFYMGDSKIEIPMKRYGIRWLLLR